jgi:hypothetical protein
MRFRGMGHLKPLGSCLLLGLSFWWLGQDGTEKRDVNEGFGIQVNVR